MVIRWVELHQATHAGAAKVMCGDGRSVQRWKRERLLSRIANPFDPTLRAVRSELAARGTKLS